MRLWKFAVTVLFLASGISVLAIAHPLAADASTKVAHTKNLGLTALDVSKLVASCNHLDPRESLGMSKPTLISRFHKADAMIFANGTDYSFCVVSGPGSTEAVHPTLYSNASTGMRELEALVTSNKVLHRALWANNLWFLIKVGPGVSVVKAATVGTSESSPVSDGFDLVHEKVTIDAKGKFVYGIVAGFSADGKFEGSAGLR